jgi:hypothetical protein
MESDVPPVQDYEVHELTKVSKDYKYGCNNRRAMSKHYFAPNRRYYADGTYQLGQTKIVHAMSTDCRYDLSSNDNACRGCKHKKGKQ